MNLCYPFPAIVGHEPVKTALMLAAVDRRIGGVLIEGPRGMAKSTLARGLADLLPEGREHFVTLPLGASEDRVTGSLDLQRALVDGEVHFSPGLLQRAHHGVLYVDEVNLLPDHLVDLLLDVAASGVNLIERDGVSHQHPAAIILIGTMNPDEGELRPQLLDRFGLAAALADHPPRSERAEVLRRRLAFDDDPTGFIEAYTTRMQALAAAITRARELLPAVTWDDGLPDLIAERCEQARAEGLRADIVMLRAARAHAALAGRDAITEDDVDRVAPLALHHRRRPAQQIPTEASTQPSPPQPPAAGHTSAPNDGANSREDSSGGGSGGGSDSGGEWGELPPTPVAIGAYRELALGAQTRTRKKKSADR